ncbi:hypothetical protein V6M85_02850 [Sulfolobus tengchongensis]|uniref:Uncharacterized protein n=1 Tax=Sulfolobus tengchongensis TaxID=207809 RepID=A0AAX4L4B2_9CREN
MRVLHGTWDGKDFYIWVEDSDEKELGSVKKKIIDKLRHELTFNPEALAVIDVLFPQRMISLSFIPILQPLMYLFLKFLHLKSLLMIFLIYY